MQEFHQSWMPGNPWPANRQQWVQATLPHLRMFFQKNPSYPQMFLQETVTHILTLPFSGPGDLDLIYDGLVDYVTGHRYFLLESQLSKLDPAAKKDLFESTPRSIRVPGSGQRWQGLKDLGECEATTYLIDDVLVGGTVAMIFGAPGDGKTFVTLDMSISIASGRPWNGLHTERGGVLYFCLEGGAGFRNRVRAAAQKGLLGPGDPFEFCTDSIDIRSADAHTKILADVKAMEAKHGTKVRLIVIDTLAVATAGGNENTSEDMGAALLQVGEAVKASGAAALLVHHPGKDRSRGARGWSGIGGNIDTIIETERSGNLRTLHVRKQKDGIEGQTYSFELETVTLGYTERLKPITSCVVKHLTQEEAANAVAGSVADDPKATLRLLRNGRLEDEVINSAIVNEVLGYAGTDSSVSIRAGGTMDRLEQAGLVKKTKPGPRNTRQCQLTPEGKVVVRAGSDRSHDDE
jgi:hypothetical protein